LETVGNWNFEIKWRNEWTELCKNGAEEWTGDGETLSATWCETRCAVTVRILETGETLF